jgi:hypothetical protein
MLPGYLRGIKAGGSQVADQQYDALLAAGVDGWVVYKDATSGKQDEAPGVKALRDGERPGIGMCNPPLCHRCSSACRLKESSPTWGNNAGRLVP